MCRCFEHTVSALAYSIIYERCGDRGDREAFPHNRVARFVLSQQARMPDYLRVPIVCLTVAFDAWGIIHGGRPFHSLPHGRRWQIVEAWGTSRLGFRRDLIKFFESLVVFGWFSETHGQ